MTTEEKSRCHTIIHSAAGIRVVMAQMPGTDVPIIVGIDITMTIA